MKHGIARTRIKQSKRSASEHRMVVALDAACREQVVIFRDHDICQRCLLRGSELYQDGNVVIIQWSHVRSRQHYCFKVG